jgi:melanoma-associated antigen p97
LILFLLADSLSYYAVAAVKKGSLSDVRTLKDLRNKKACFAGVGTQAGWVIPIDVVRKQFFINLTALSNIYNFYLKIMKEGGLSIVDCNNHVKSAIEYFGPSCAVNSLADKYNPIGKIIDATP